MRCHACQRRYAANWRASAPGGYGTPRGFLLAMGAAVGLGVIGLLLVNSAWLTLVGAAGAALCALALVVTMIDCSGRCPHCDARSRIRPWSG